MTSSVRRSLSLGAFIIIIATLAASARADQAAAKQLKQEIAAAGADVDKQIAAVEKAAKSDDGDTADALLKLAAVDEIPWKLRDAAIAALRAFKSDSAKNAVATAIAKSPDAKLRAIGCVVARAHGDDAALKALVPALKDKEWPVQAAAIEGLKAIKKKETIEALVAAYKDAKEPRVTAELQGALVALTNEHAPKSAAEWTSWWETTKEKFSFDAPAPGSGDEGGAPRTQVRTTPDGSGLYSTISSNHVVFVVDVSGSMITRSNTVDGKNLSRIEYVKQELCNAIDSQLPKNAFFNIISFSDGVTPWRKKLVPASPDMKKAAKEFVHRMEAKGETNAFDALEAAFSDRSVDTIYFLTDGFPTTCSCKDQRHAAQSEILGEVRKWNATRHVKLFCMAFVFGDGAKFNVVEDKGMSKNFMKKLAEENGGEYRCFE